MYRNEMGQVNLLYLIGIALIDRVDFDLRFSFYKVELHSCGRESQLSEFSFSIRTKLFSEKNNSISFLSWCCKNIELERQALYEVIQAFFLFAVRKGHRYSSFHGWVQLSCCVVQKFREMQPLSPEEEQIRSAERAKRRKKREEKRANRKGVAFLSPLVTNNEKMTQK